MQVLPNVPYRLINKFYDLVVSYLWGDKKPKIKLNILQLDKSKGGLRLVDLFYRQISLKAQWIVIIRNSTFWSKIAYEQINPRLNDRIWLCNLSTNDIETVCSNDGFWSQVLYSWCLFNFKEEVDKEVINCEILWFNSHMRIADKVFCWYDCWEAGLVHIHQLFDRSGQIRSYESIKESFGNVLSWYQYAQLINAIPVTWKTVLTNEYSNEVAFTNFEIIVNETKISNKVYSKINAHKSLPIQQKAKWEKLVNSQISDREYAKLFTFPQKVTIATKYRDFQYRMLHSAIITNRTLYLWKILPSDKCSFCKKHPERIPHLFYLCEFTCLFWQDIKEYVDDNATEDAQICQWLLNSILANEVYPKPSHIINLIVLVAKQYIYRQRCFKNKPIARVFIREFEQIYKMEFKIACEENRLRRHYEKWSRIKPELETNLLELDNQPFIDQYVQQM